MAAGRVFVQEKRWEVSGGFVFGHEFIKILLGGHLNNLRAKKMCLIYVEISNRKKMISLRILSRFNEDCCYNI